MRYFLAIIGAPLLAIGVLALALWVSEGSTPSPQHSTWWLKSDKLN